MARRTGKVSTFRRFSDALKLLVELGEYPRQVAETKLVQALAVAPRAAWKAKFEGHSVPDLWKRLSGEGEPQMFVNPHYEENWVGACDARGPYVAYGIRVAEDVLLPLLPAKARVKLSSDRRSRTEREPIYSHEDIRAVAEQAAKDGRDAHRSWFFDRVRELCRQRRPRIPTPANDRTMGRIIGDLYQSPKR
jgi:hypothetical protein